MASGQDFNFMTENEHAAKTLENAKKIDGAALWPQLSKKQRGMMGLCRNETCRNIRAHGSSRCAGCSEKYRSQKL